MKFVDLKPQIIYNFEIDHFADPLPVLSEHSLGRMFHFFLFVARIDRE